MRNLFYDHLLIIILLNKFNITLEIYKSIVYEKPFSH